MKGLFSRRVSLNYPTKNSVSVKSFSTPVEQALTADMTVPGACTFGQS